MWMLTSLESPLSDFMAENPQACPIVGRHLNLIVSPDDEVFQEQGGHIWAGDVLDLVIHRQPGEAVSKRHDIWKALNAVVCEGGEEGWCMLSLVCSVVVGL